MEVFSSSRDGMTFVDFLDMMSVFSDNAPKPVKMEYAFRIYGKYVFVVREACVEGLGVGEGGKRDCSTLYSVLITKFPFFFFSYVKIFVRCRRQA